MVDNEKNKLTHEYLKYTFKSAFCKITSPHVPPPPKKNACKILRQNEFHLRSINMYSSTNRESTVLSYPLRFKN